MIVEKPLLSNKNNLMWNKYSLWQTVKKIIVNQNKKNNGINKKKAEIIEKQKTEVEGWT